MTAACNDFEPLLFEFGVDLYLAGHLHFYQRFDGALRRGMVVSNGTVNPRGPIHVTTGSGGPPKGTSCDHFGRRGHPPAGVYNLCRRPAVQLLPADRVKRDALDVGASLKQRIGSR
eukprot:SAG22_NODE_3491_length_1683_cov_1.743687_2_plen_116_part_00